jgi:hypothetical protein
VCVPASTIISVFTEYNVSYEIELMPSEIAVKMVTRLVNNAAGSILMAKYILQASIKNSKIQKKRIQNKT